VVAERIIGIWTTLSDTRAALRAGAGFGVAAIRRVQGARRRIGRERRGLLRRGLARWATRLLKALVVRGRLIPPELSAPLPGDGAEVDLDHLIRHPRPGISVVTACRNRLDNLKQVLPGWLACPEISEVVIVDWGSDTPVRIGLRQAGLRDPRLKILQVPAAERWILAQAFNAGVRAAGHQMILKLDADIQLKEGFFDALPRKPGGFVAGNWRLAAAGQEYINGVVFLARADFLKIGGFNEFITSYGWDDDDLYARLGAAGLQRRDLSVAHVHHLPHDDSARLERANPPENAREALFSSPRFLIETNRILCCLMPRWGAHHPMRPFRVRALSQGVLEAQSDPDHPDPVPAAIREDAKTYAARHVLSWDLGDETVFSLSRAQLDERLAAAPRLDALAAPALGLQRPRLFVDTRHGLGNRLRAMASAAALARQDGRELVVIWQPDHHCQCRLPDLFAYDGALIEDSFLPRARAEGMVVYNYMEAEPDSAKDALITRAPGRDIYVRSAYPLNSPRTDWDRANAFLKGLTVVDAVQDLLGGVRRHNALGVHVRMEGAPGSDHNSYDRVENWTPEGQKQLHYWRRRSHYARFMARIDTLIATGEIETLFLAADTAQTYQAFQARYGPRLACLERPLYDRSREQIQYALADVLLLAECRKMLGSSWSSFSELALRLSDNFSQIEMSGQDF